MMRRMLPLAWVGMAGLLAGCATMTSPSKPAASSARAQVSVSDLKDKLFYHVLVGDIAGQQGRLGEAAHAFGQAAQESGDRGLTRRSALLSLYARRYVQAHQLARLWVHEAPASAGALEALADANLGLGHVALSEQQFERALALVTVHEGPGGRAFAFEHIATLLLRHRPSPQVVVVMRALSQHYPRDAVGDYALADLARQSHHPHQALRAINRALVLKPYWEDAAVLKARILWAQSPAAALHFSHQFLQANPEATRLRLDYARRLVSLQYWQKALAQFQVIAEAAPNDPQVLYAAGLLALRTHKPLLARKYLKRSLALAPADSHAKLYLGEIAERARRFARARYYYREVGPPYRFDAAVRLGLMFLKEGRPLLASQKLARVTPRTRTEEVTLALARNQVLVTLHRYNEGLKVVSRAMVGTEHRSGLLYARALDEEKLGQQSAAVRDLKVLLARHPYDPVALNALGYTLINHGHHLRRGLVLVRKALVLDPKSPYILDSVGWAYYRLGQFRAAVSYLRKALVLSHDPTIAAHLGAALWAQGERIEALQVWRAALVKSPDNPALKAQIARHP